MTAKREAEKILTELRDLISNIVKRLASPQLALPPRRRASGGAKAADMPAALGFRFRVNDEERISVRLQEAQF